MQIHSYRDLIVWRKSIELVVVVYEATEKFPKHELYGLVSQMRRAAVSIPSNIAEGYRRRVLGEYIQFLGIANASAGEIETQLIITRKIYPEIECTVSLEVVSEIQKMLTVMIRKLNAKR